ncbi:MAG: hypothetical protein KAW12_17315 [Candidatus Aminicenantes bacterium]|nr:hypothetical protein [Candidatus Aminicenantes bacterium]
MSKLTGIKKNREKTGRFGSSAAEFVRRWKIFAVTILLSCIAAVLILLGLIPGIGKKTTANPLEKLKESGKVIIKTGTSSDEEKNTSLTQQDSLEIMQQAATEMKKRAQREIQGLPFVLADKETLLAFLPAVEGWQMQESQYHRGGYGGRETSNLNTKYLDSAGKAIEVELIDYSAVPAALQPLKIIFNMERSEEDKRRNEKVSIYNGVPVREEYNFRTKLAQFSAILKKRYIITLKCRGSGCRRTLQGFMPGVLEVGDPNR